MHDKAKRFGSEFKEDILSFLAFRQSAGFTGKEMERRLSSFDAFCVGRGRTPGSLTRELVEEWLAFERGNHPAGISTMASSIRIFGRYLKSIGKDAFVYNQRLSGKRRKCQPYIFSDDEIKALFDASDKYAESPDSMECMVMPVLLRLIYTCGLRPGEARLLERSDINCDDGTLLVRKNKLRAERKIPMSWDTAEMISRHLSVSHSILGNTKYVFTGADAKPLASSAVNAAFTRIWRSACQRLNVSDVPRVRVYDLRHRFASAVLQRAAMEEDGVYRIIPFLKAYLGHKELSQTMYYVHLMPEYLLASKAIDWDSLNNIIPEA